MASSGKVPILATGLYSTLPIPLSLNSTPTSIFLNLPLNKSLTALSIALAYPWPTISPSLGFFRTTSASSKPLILESKYSLASSSESK